MGLIVQEKKGKKNKNSEKYIIKIVWKRWGVIKNLRMFFHSLGIYICCWIFNFNVFGYWLYLELESAVVR